VSSVVGNVRVENADERRRRERGIAAEPTRRREERPAPAFPVSALRSDPGDGETLSFELDQVGVRKIVRIRVERDGIVTGEVEFSADHLSAFRATRIRDLLLVAWRCGMVGDWAVAGSAFS